jgi:ribonuclease P protein component
MERKYHLRLNTDFQRVRQKGKSWANHLIVLYALPNDLEFSRFGFAVSKRIGKAVVRNRVRRRMREAVRLRRASIASGWDIVFIARSSLVGAAHAEISHAVEDLVKRAHLLAPAGPRGPGSAPAAWPAVEPEPAPPRRHRGPGCTSPENGSA